MKCGEVYTITTEEDGLGKLKLGVCYISMFDTEEAADLFAAQETLKTNQSYQVVKEYINASGQSVLSDTYIEKEV